MQDEFAYSRAKVAALRAKLVMLSMVVAGLPCLLLVLMWSSELGRELADAVGWELQALLVGMVLFGAAMVVYGFVFFKVPPPIGPFPTPPDTPPTP